MKILDEFFEKWKIEYYSVIDFAHLKVSNERIMSRCSLTPRTAIIFLLPYFTSIPKNISRYATSLDYHILVKKVTGELCDILSREFVGSVSYGFGDHSPIDERHGALISGLGALGDNGLLINEKYGSYVFIADVITDIPSEMLGATPPCEISRCIQCGACRRACPTSILNGEGSDCLSAITQRKGELTDEEISLMIKYNTIWGCDICQAVCPYNKSPIKTPIDFFYDNTLHELTREYLDSITDDELRLRAFGWRGRAVLERNLDKMEK